MLDNVFRRCIMVVEDGTVVGGTSMRIRKEQPDTETCLFCKEWVTDGRDVSGYTGLGPDWMLDGDFGCDYNPITSEEGCGPHWTLYDATGLYMAAEFDAERRREPRCRA